MLTAWFQKQAWQVYMAIYTYTGAPNQSAHMWVNTLTYPPSRRIEYPSIWAIACKWWPLKNHTFELTALLDYTFWKKRVEPVTLIYKPSIFITARKRSFGQGNKFTGVCLSTDGGLYPSMQWANSI